MRLTLSMSPQRRRLSRAMVQGPLKFLPTGQKSFDIVGEGDGVRIFENGKGTRKSILYQKEEAEWLRGSFRQFWWEKEEDGWGRYWWKRNHTL